MSVIRSPLRSPIYSPIYDPLVGKWGAVEEPEEEEFSPGDIDGLIAWWDATNINSLFQDVDGNTAVASDGDPIGRVEDQSGNDIHLLAEVDGEVTLAAEYQADPAAMVVGEDTSIESLLPAAETTEMTFMLGTTTGILYGQMNYEADYIRPLSDAWANSGFISMILVAGEMSAQDAASMKTWFAGKGAGTNHETATNMEDWLGSSLITDVYDLDTWDTSSVTTMAYLFSGAGMTSIDVSGFDTSAVEDMEGVFTNCTSLTALDLSNWDTSSVTSFIEFAAEAESLATVTLTGGTGSPFADSPCTDYTDAFSGTNLSEASIDAILVAIESANTSNGTFDQSGGSAPSSTGEAAITAMRSRGWTVTVTGGF